MKVTPLGHHVLLECIDNPEPTPADAHKPLAHAEAHAKSRAKAKGLPGSNFGTVVAVGCCVNLHKGVDPEIKPGDVVTYGKSVDGQGYEDEGKHYKLVHDCEVFARVEP